MDSVHVAIADSAAAATSVVIDPLLQVVLSLAFSTTSRQIDNWRQLHQLQRPFLV